MKDSIPRPNEQNFRLKRTIIRSAEQELTKKNIATVRESSRSHTTTTRGNNLRKIRNDVSVKIESEN